MQESAARPRFGTVDEISGTEFVQKVTEASRAYWVVCLLYKASHAGCQLLESCLRELARKHPNTRFLKIVSTSCIPNYPDANLPTLLVYHNGACQKQVVGMQPFGGGRATPEQVALALSGWGAIGGEGEEGGEDGAGEAAAARHVRGLVQRLVEQREEAATQKDESSDFDD
jgi:hypothetical protein